MSASVMKRKHREMPKRPGIMNRPLRDKRFGDTMIFDPKEVKATTDKYNATRHAYAIIWASMRP